MSSVTTLYFLRASSYSGPTILTSTQSVMCSYTHAHTVPQQNKPLYCTTQFIPLIHYKLALFAQSAKCVFEYYSTFTLGIWSLLLNAHDLFFHLILLSITTSWCNAPVNPCTLTICLCSCNNTALHAAWMTIMTNAVQHCTLVQPLLNCRYNFLVLHHLFTSSLRF